MTRPLLLCQACGCSSANQEGFRILRTTQPEAEELTLCPACAALREQASGFELAYRFCDQCAAPVEADRLELRSRTDTAMLGAQMNHRMVTFALCPACVRAYDRTGRGLILGIVLFFVAALTLFILLGWLFG